MMGSTKRLLLLGHRWLGVLCALFFLLWFISGMVMMYVGYPKLTEHERLRHLPALGTGQQLLPPAEALHRAGVQGPLQTLRLLVVGNQPVYITAPQPADTGAEGASAARDIVIDARTGLRLPAPGTREALHSAIRHAGGQVSVRYLDQIHEDAFSHSRALDPHRPLHRVRLDDDARTQLYISGQTGEVVRDATRTERRWNYLGAWLHWLYLFRGNAFDGWWTAIIDTLATLGVLAALSGLINGCLRWRFGQPYRHGGRSPFREWMMRWHHVLGLVCGLTTLTWIFSGLMSMNPAGVFDGDAAPLDTSALLGPPLQAERSLAAPATLLHHAGRDVRELSWIRSLGHTMVLASDGQGRRLLLDGRSGQPVVPDPQVLRQAAARLLDSPVLRMDTLHAYDFHYYARADHTMTGGPILPLPMLRVQFDDPARTWVQIDPATGQVLGRLGSAQRLERWLFSLLHSWDWLPLLQRRPLWDGWMLLWSVGGTVLSLTAVVIGVRRLRSKSRQLASRQRRRAAAP